MNTTVLLTLSGSVAETLKVMAQADAKVSKAFVEKDWRSPTAISVAVNLESPPYQGQIRFHFTGPTIILLCKAMLAENVDPESPEALDCAGEISNMFFGFAKAKLNDSGYNFKLSIPVPYSRDLLPHLKSGFSNVIIPFQVRNEVCYIQIIVL